MHINPTAIRIAIVEDDVEYSNELNLFLSHQPEIFSVTVDGSLEAFLKPPIAYIPDIILLDVGLPGIDGITGIPLIRQQYPQADIIMLTLFADHLTVFNSLCSGAVGYVLKESVLADLRDAVLTVARGGSYMSPSIARQVVGYFAPLKSNDTDALTSREQDVVNGIADGLSYKLIADRLSIKVATVQSYIKSIYRKLNVNSKTEVVRKMKNNLFH
jgi:DNA-binding NarL/FixJ family response regulator